MASIAYVGPTFHDETVRTASGSGPIDSPTFTLASSDVPGSASSLVIICRRYTATRSSSGAFSFVTPSGFTSLTSSVVTTTGGGGTRQRHLSFSYARRGDLSFPLTFALDISEAIQSGAYLALTPVVVSGGEQTVVGPTNGNSSTPTTAAQTLVVADTRGAVMLHGYASFYQNSGLDSSGGLTPPDPTSLSTANGFTLQSDDVTNQEPAGWAPFANIGFETFGLASRIVTTPATYDLPRWDSTANNVVSGAGWGQRFGRRGLGMIRG